MKKRFLVAAMAATMVSPLAAFADATVYGNVHLSIDSFDDDVAATDEELTMSSNTSAIGVKGKEDLGGGLSAIFKVEFQIDPDERAKIITDRDQWVGLKGSWGSVKLGTMSSNYKQMGGKIDPMYRTKLEGRASGAQSSLHKGAGIEGGRMTNAVQYSSPKMGGMWVVANTTFEGVKDESFGVGFRFKNKAALAYFDYLDVPCAACTGATESAIKLGGSYKIAKFTVGLQHELTEDLLGQDTTFLSGKMDLNSTDMIAVTFGSSAAKSTTVGDDGSAMAFMYDHKLSKRTNVYAGYGVEDMDDDGLDNSDLTFGIRHKF